MNTLTLQYETDRDKLRRLLTFFEENWSCEACQAKSAYWLEDCTNPLHQLQEALWELDADDKAAKA
jgi:hypothetical protein